MSISGAVLTPLLALALAGDPDPWFGPDKIKHFFMTAFVQSVVYSGLRATGAEHRSSLYGAAGASAAFGIGKELFDRRRNGTFSVPDLVWDAAGAGGASLLLDRTRR